MIQVEDLNSPVFDVSGKEVNKFDAKSYFSKDKDPYRDIILDYQRKLRENRKKTFLVFEDESSS